MVSVGAIMVVKHTVRAKQYLWASGFVGMAILLNPIVPIFTPAGNLMLLLFWVGLSPIVITFAALIDANCHALSQRDRGAALARRIA
jgi:hypothetical protein